MIGIKTDSELKVFNQNLMNKIKVSNEDYFQVIRSKKSASKFTHIQYNHLSGNNYICLDCDIDVFQTLSDKNINPNLLVVNKDNNRGHFYFRLESFVGTTEAARIKPQKALRLLTHSLNNHLCTDKAFNGMQGKNPLNSDYRVFSYTDKPYSFSELFDNIPDEKIYLNEPQRIITESKEILQVNTGERTIYLFDSVRFHAYKAKHRHSSYESFYKEIHSVYTDLNAMLSEPLTFNECKNAIKSIASWTWANYSGDQKNRGVLQLDLRGQALTLQERQVVGAKYTHKKQRESTLEAIQAAFDDLTGKGIKPTQKAVSEHSGKGERTVRRYWDEINK